MAANESRYRVLVTDFVWPTTQPEREVLSRIGAEVIEAPDPSEDTLVSLAAEADAIMTCFAQVTAAVVRAAHKCLVISRYGVGVDNIAVDTATQEGIAVTYVPDYCVDEVSDHVMALLLSWNRQLAFYDGVAKEGRVLGWCACSGALGSPPWPHHGHRGAGAHRSCRGRQSPGLRLGSSGP